MELGFIDTDAADWPLIEQHIGDVIAADKVTELLEWDEPENGCWEWSGATNNGRGVVTFQGVSILAYRLSYYLFNDVWPVGSCRHLCGNKLCISPAHLADDGLVSQNTLDMRFHNYLKSIGLRAPFPLALRDWGDRDNATGEELYAVWRKANV